MISNPFSPIFGGKPDIFFGRERILNLFDLAMIDYGSDERAIFITGTRGSGKTALLEQLSQRARKKKRRVIDLGPENTIDQLLYELSDYDEITTAVSPQANVNVLGFGGGISGGSVAKTRHIGRETLQPLLLEVCSKSRQGLLVTVDEIQKVPVEDVSSLCNAFQMASRKGYDIMLAVAGLPYAYNTITRHEGCTYLRRASHEEIGLFTWEEAADAIYKVFSGIKGLSIEKPLLDRINQISFGHPYIMQLIGYHLILRINQTNPNKKHTVSEEELDAAEKDALLAYEQRALKSLFEELPDSEKRYLVKMAECMGEDRFVLTADISRALGVPQSRLTRTRAYLMNQGIIASPAHGKVMFCVPYLSDYVKKEKNISGNMEVVIQRKV